MTKKPILFAIAVSAFLATGAMMNIDAVNAAPVCPPGFVCPPDGLHRPHAEPSGPGMQTPRDNQPMHWRHRHQGYPDGNVGFGIYVGNGYGDLYRTRWHHRHNCSMVKIWRHHHRVWVKRCDWHR